jgi:hypothetical protein
MQGAALQGVACDLHPVRHGTCHMPCLPAVLQPWQARAGAGHGSEPPRGRAPQAGLNMIRLWGGAAVARDAFYDACDEAGILARPQHTALVQNYMLMCCSRNAFHGACNEAGILARAPKNTASV